MIDKDRLAQKCSTWNIQLSGAQLDLLDRYAALLVDYNQKVNLTAITTPEALRTGILPTACCLPPSRRWPAPWWTWAPAPGSPAWWPRSTSPTWR